MRILLFPLLPTIAFCQTFAVDSVYRNGIIHPHEEHEWVVSDTSDAFKGVREERTKNDPIFVNGIKYPVQDYVIEYYEDVPRRYFTVCRLCGRKLRWSELPPPPLKTEFQRIDSAWTGTGTAYILEEVSKWLHSKQKPPKYFFLGSDGKPKGFTN